MRKAVMSYVLPVSVVATFAIATLSIAPCLAASLDGTNTPIGMAGMLGMEGLEKRPSPLVPEGLVSLSGRSEFSQHIFVVDKSKRVLRLYQLDNNVPRLVDEFPSDLGKHVGPKAKANDFRTPVGIYFLQKKLQPPEIPFSLYGSLAFTTDYPNIFDKRDAKTGSGIWLHAVPDRVALTRGSRGCVVVRNNVVRKLADYVHLQQTPLVIYDKIKEVTADEYLSQRDTFLKFVDTWRQAWQKEDVDTYIKFYDPTFYNSEMNYSQWYNHKKRLKGTYKFIEVKFSEPLILRNDDQVVIRMLQHYKSDLHEDFGEKTIHAHYSPETGFRIVREDWKPAAMPADWIKENQSDMPEAQRQRTLSTIDKAAPSTN